MRPPFKIPRIFGDLVEQPPQFAHICLEVRRWSAAAHLIHLRTGFHAMGPGQRNVEGKPLHESAQWDPLSRANRFFASHRTKRISEMADHLGSSHFAPAALGGRLHAAQAAQDLLSDLRVGESFHAQILQHAVTRRRVARWRVVSSIQELALNPSTLEPITHFLAGACMGRAGFNRKTALATATMTLAAEAPDLDMLGYFKNPVFGFGHHRGFTHSLLGIFLVSAVVVGFMYLVWRVRGRKTKSQLPPRWGLLFVFAYVAGLSHLVLDYTNSYGLRPFWPFSERWYSWDIVSIVEPALLIFLVGGLVLPSLFGLVNQEIGVRSKGPKGRWAATFALMGLVVVWSVRDYEHRRAVNALEARTYHGADPLRASAFPYIWNPFRWSGVVETKGFFASTLVDSSVPDVDPEGHMQIRYKPEETPITLAAKESYLGRVYLDWAAYPITETQQVDDPPGYSVQFIDLRYVFPGESQPHLTAQVRLSDSLAVLAESFGVRRRFFGIDQRGRGSGSP
jgi:inner membrane protein